MDKYKLDDKLLGNYRKDAISWDEAFMMHAIISSGRSKDPSTQVGACIVDNNNRILSLGYNGSPNSWDDSLFPWDRDHDNNIHNKYPYVIHAEMNALLNYKGSHKDLEGATVYVTLFPCHECAKFLAQAGIKRVVYLSDKFINTEDNIMSKTCLEYCGIEFVKLETLNKEFILTLIPEEESKDKYIRRVGDKNEC